jgi:hypothetical protein
MELNQHESFKLKMLRRQLGDLSLHEAAQHYKEYTKTYLSLELGDTAEFHFIRERTQLQEYGNLLTLSQCNDENLMDYEIDLCANHSNAGIGTMVERISLVKEIGRSCFANVLQPDIGKLIFAYSAYLLPLIHPTDKTDHVMIKAFLQEYGLKYRRTAAQFTYAIK